MTLLLPPSPTQRLLRVTPSLDSILQYWRDLARSDNPLAPLARHLEEQLDAHPELGGPLRKEAIEANQALVETLVSCVLPPALRRFSFAALAAPSSHDIYWATPRFQRELLLEDGQLRGEVHLEGMSWEYLLELMQFLMVARECYGKDFPFQKSVQLEQRVEGSDRLRYFQLRKHFEHIELRAPNPLPAVTEAAWAELAENLDNLEIWRRTIPLDQFEQYGLAVFEATEITEEMTLSAIKQELVGRNSLFRFESFERIRSRLRTLLDCDDLHLSVEGVQDRWIVELSPRGGAALTDWGEIQYSELEGRVSPEQRACLEEYGTIVIEDVLAETELCPLYDQARQLGWRSLLIMALRLDDRLVGVLTLASPRPHRLNNLTPFRLTELTPLLTLAVRRSMENIQQRIEGTIKERYTALHPAVEWKFRRQAFEVMQSQCSVETMAQDILFADVYPLFGASDVRNSTVIRNQTIEQDLSRQLLLARTVLEQAHQARKLTYLSSRRYRLNRWLHHLQQGMDSGDEARITEFLRSEIEPLFTTLEKFSPETQAAVDAYRAALDPEMGMVHDERRHYEHSMALIKERTAEILNRRQREAQAVFPHYFELHKSDGVDHSMYVGASIHPEGEFDPLYLRNLRQWQLETMVEIAAKGQFWVKDMTCVLESAHLLLVQDRPLSIRFSQDEKQFNVDGAYNARYEILKKRLDKAEIRDSGERLTQPGKVAIVYSHPREASEYRDYIEYLQAQGVLESEIEELEIAPLQGVIGLRALRVSARLAPSRNGIKQTLETL